MPGLPESFDVAKRIGLFVYLARNIKQTTPMEELFSTYQNDLPKLRKSIKKYRIDCKNTIVRKKLMTGLVSSKGLTSFSKYLRIGNGLGIFDFELGLKLVHPNWLTYVVNGLSEIEHTSIFEMEIHNTLKLLFTRLIIEKDGDLTIPLVIALDKVNPSCLEVNTKQLQLEYAKTLKQAFAKILEFGLPNSHDYITYVKRYEFFERNIELLDKGLQPTRGLKHMIDSRVNWLLDLQLVDYKLLCNKGRIRPLPILKRQMVLINQKALENEEFYKGYVEYLRKQGIIPEKPFTKGEGVNELVDTALGILAKEYKDLLLIEAVLLMSWSLCNTRLRRYTSSYRILDVIRKKYITYRRKMEGLGFIKV